jgi:hypothetical protein
MAFTRPGASTPAAAARHLSLTAAVAVLLPLISAGAGEAATLRVHEINEAVEVISVDGPIEVGDHRRFAALARSSSRQKIVFLNSMGGQLLEGLAMGRAIRGSGMATAVGGEGHCASVCALMWLAGQTRYLERGAQVGFHAAYWATRRKSEVSSVGNAHVGYYLAEIEASPHIIELATRARPEVIEWLTADDLLSHGIAVVSAAAIEDAQSVLSVWAQAPRPYDADPLAEDGLPLQQVGRWAQRRFEDVRATAGMAGATEHSATCWAMAHKDGSLQSIQPCYMFDLRAYLATARSESAAGMARPPWFQPIEISSRVTLAMKANGYTARQVEEVMGFCWMFLPKQGPAATF